jgi:hypothetical protein
LVGELDVPRTFPWHAATSDVYHNNSDCKTGRGVAQEERLSGTGGKPLCRECTELNQAPRGPDPGLA